MDGSGCGSGNAACAARQREKRIEAAWKGDGQVAGLLLVQIGITRCAAAAGLCLLGEHDALPTVLAALDDESAIAAFALIDVAPESETAVEALEKALAAIRK